MRHVTLRVMVVMVRGSHGPRRGTVWMSERVESRSAMRPAATQVMALMVADHVARTAHGVDERKVEAAVDLAPQAAHVDVRSRWSEGRSGSPYRFEQHGAGDHLPGVAHQVLEQAELAGLELDGASGAPDGVREEVHLQIRGYEPGDRRPIAAAPPRERLDPGRELGEREGLDEIVVAARAAGPPPGRRPRRGRSARAPGPADPPRASERTIDRPSRPGSIRSTTITSWPASSASSSPSFPSPA